MPGLWPLTLAGRASRTAVALGFPFPTHALPPECPEADSEALGDNSAIWPAAVSQRPGLRPTSRSARQRVLAPGCGPKASFSPQRYPLSRPGLPIPVGQPG